MREKIGDVSVEKIAEYLKKHFREVRDDLCEMKELWRNEMHREVGERSARLVQDIVEPEGKLLMAAIVAGGVEERSPLEAEQEFLNGFYTEFDLPEPKTVMKCFPE